LTAAKSGLVGLALARTRQPAVVILSLDLPDLPGEDVLQLLRSDDATRDVPVVVISADAQQRRIEQVLQSGALEYLTKPIDVNHLLFVLDGLLHLDRRDTE
jgi:CheY-like chemotaxis protein